MKKYILQRLEPYTIPNILGNCSFPVHTHRWKDIAVSEDKQAIEDIMPNNKNYRIDEREVNYA